MTFGEYVCILDTLLLDEQTLDIEKRIYALIANPFIDDKESEFKKLRLELKSLQQNYMDCKD